MQMLPRHCSSLSQVLGCQTPTREEDNNELNVRIPNIFSHFINVPLAESCVDATYPAYDPEELCTI